MRLYISHNLNKNSNLKRCIICEGIHDYQIKKSKNGKPFIKNARCIGFVMVKIKNILTFDNLYEENSIFHLLSC